MSSNAMHASPRLNLTELLSDWDGEELIVRRDGPTGAWVFIAIHSTRLGPADGGTRIRRYNDLNQALSEALRLSRGMTDKFAAAGMSHGGGKAVIALPDGFDPAQRTGLLQRYGRLIGRLGGLYTTAPDVGSSAGDMDIVAQYGAPYVFGCTPSDPATPPPGTFAALGVFSAMERIARELSPTGSLRGCRVVVQGVGNVGRRLVAYLLAAGAEVVYGDPDPQRVAACRAEMPGAHVVDADDLDRRPCDIFSPCALGGSLNRASIPRLQCRAVVGAANNQLAEPEDAARLQARGILYVSDFLVNVGEAMADLGMAEQGWSRHQAEQDVRARVADTVSEVLARAAATGVDVESAARRLVDERLAAALD
jgi:leucine dehydrogenase